MSRNHWTLKLWTALATVAMLAGLAVRVSGQEKPKEQQTQRVPGVEDWSSHHLIFSNPGNFSEGTKTRSFTDWYRIQNDPRYHMFVAKRKAALARGAAGTGAAEPEAVSTSDSVESVVDSITSNVAAKPAPAKTKTKPKPQGDWNIYLGGATSAGIAPAMFPAKYTWDLNADPDCNKDFVVVPVNQASASQKSATGTVTFTSNLSGGAGITIGSVTYIWHGTCGTDVNCLTGTTTTTTEATELANAITSGTCQGTGGCASDPAVTASASGSVVTLTAATAGLAGNSIALSTTSTSDTVSGSGFLTGGADGQASVVAFNQLYDAVGTTATQTGTLTGNVLSPPTNSSVTINGVKLTASDPTTASQTGTFSSPPTAASSITIVNGTNTLTLTTSAVTASYHLVFSGTASSTGSVSIVYTGGTSSNTLVMSPGASNGCTSSTVGTFSNATSSTTRATNFNAAITSCVGTYPAIGITSSRSSSTDTLTAALPGNFLTVTDSLTNTTGSGVNVAGSNGSNTCTTSTTGHYATSNLTTTLATNLSAAINACPTGTGITKTSSVSGSSVTITALAAGSSGNSITVTPSTTGFFQWGAGALAGGGNGTTGGTTFAYWSGASAVSTAQLGANIVSAINTNTSTDLVTAAATGTTTITITLTATPVGAAGNSITTTSGLADFGWTSGTLAGGTDQGPCGAGQPSIMWAYNASTAATASPILGSPVLSLDGTQVAFIESASSGMILHVLRPGTGSGQQGNTTLDGTPALPTTSTNSGTTYSSCVAGTNSCMFNLTFPTGVSNNTNSPPFYDYGTDTLWVGDNGGKLWEVTPVFSGTPAVYTAGAWATGVTVDSGATLTGPVEDFSSGNMLVGDSSGELSAVTSTGAVSHVTGLGAIVDPPIIDSSYTPGHVFVFSGGNGTNAIVNEYNATLGTALATENIGYNSPTTHVHTGSFDNTYYNSPDGTGHLYVCGKRSGTGNIGAALYNITLTSGLMTGVGTAINLTTAATTAGECSPLSEIYNPTSGSGTDWLFVGVPSACSYGTGTTGGCVIAFNITSGSAVESAAAAENGGTSGIIIDNVSPTNGASSAYFTTLTAPGAGGCNSEPTADNTTCLVKRTQSGLN